jgi:hypothetical protein
MAQSPFIRHLAAFTTALGVENAPAVFTFASAPWKDDEQRDEFIKDLTDLDMTEVNNYD